MVSPAAAPVELPPRYYLDNFQRLCTTVESQYGDLLSADEQQFLAALQCLDEAARCLYVRLVSRVGPWFRADKLDYPEIGPVTVPLRELQQAKLAQAADALAAIDLGQLFTRAELTAMFAEELAADLGRAPDKTSLLEAIAALELPPGNLAARAGEWVGAPIVAPLGGEHVALMQLLFFGNRRQGLTEFVLSDLGIFNYFPYQLDRSQRLFPDRTALDEYLACGLLADAYAAWRDQPDADQLCELAHQVAQFPVRSDASRRRHHRLCNAVARDLERQGQWQLAARLYALSELHPARERLARVCEATDDLPGAEQHCRAILADPWCEAERTAADRILPRVRRKAHGETSPRRRDKFVELHLEIPRLTGSVERDTAAALAGEWQHVFYVENGLMNSLFGLAFWEVIFAPVPGAFHNPFQAVPSDMYEQGFRRRRDALVQRRLAELQRVDLAAELQSVARRYRGFQNRWVSWQLLQEDLLECACACIPAAHLLAVWQRILFDPGENRRGFPDLVAFNPAQADYRMIEVKGPGDSLQDSQRHWLRFFDERQLPAAVAWVSWQDG